MRAADRWRPKRGRRLMKLISPLALLAALAIFLTGCGAAVFEPGTCPTWPVAGPAVAEEVERGIDARRPISGVLGVDGARG